MITIDHTQFSSNMSLSEGLLAISGTTAYALFTSFFDTGFLVKGNCEKMNKWAKGIII